MVTSLLYASQWLSPECMCNAERFDNKAGPFVGSVTDTIPVCNCNEDSMATKKDRTH